MQTILSHHLFLSRLSAVRHPASESGATSAVATKDVQRILRLRHGIVTGDLHQKSSDYGTGALIKSVENKNNNGIFIVTPKN